MLKSVVLLTIFFVETMIHFSVFFYEYKVQRTCLKCICNNVFIVTLKAFNASLLYIKILICLNKNVQYVA